MSDELAKALRLVEAAKEKAKEEFLNAIPKDRVYIKIPFSRDDASVKDTAIKTAKTQGAEWDNERLAFYMAKNNPHLEDYRSMSNGDLLKQKERVEARGSNHPAPLVGYQQIEQEDRRYIRLPFGSRDKDKLMEIRATAKENGAQWDKENGAWFMHKDNDKLNEYESMTKADLAASRTKAEKYRTTISERTIVSAENVANNLTKDLHKDVEKSNTKDQQRTGAER